MKHVAIISNGPSARLFDEALGAGANRDDFDLVVGVNWTVSRWLCDWWCFCDWTTFVDTEPLGKPKLFVSKFVLEKLPRHAPQHVKRLEQWGSDEIVVHESIDPPPLSAHFPKWNAFSGTAALGLAWYLRAERVTVFGADMAGSLDHANRPGPSRTPERWAHERRIFDGLTAALANHGIQLHRILSV